jgi:hypothetical protein
MSYESPNYKDVSPDEIPNDGEIAKQAWRYAVQLGCDPAQMMQGSFFTHSYDADPAGRQTTNFICGRGVFLPRKLDGIAFFFSDDTGSGAEGFSIEFGERGQIRFFNLNWSTLTRYETRQTATILRCSRDWRPRSH